MRLFAILIGGALFTAVVAEGAYILKQQKQLSSLGEKVAELESAGDRLRESAADEPTDRGASQGGDDMPPPGLVPALAAVDQAVREAGGLRGIGSAGGGDSPLPAILATPEAREQLKGFVFAQIAAEREARRQEQAQQTNQVDEQRRGEMAQKLGLSGDKALKFDEMMAGAQQKRQALMDRMRGGEGWTEDNRNQMRDLWRGTNEQMQALLGDEKFKQWEEINGTARRGGGGPGGGRGFGGGARPQAPAPPGSGPPR